MSPRRLAAVPEHQLRVVRIIRVSRARDEMISPELQDAAIDDFTERRGMATVARLEGLDESGSRPSSKWWARLDEAVSIVERGEADAVVGYKFDRAARNRLRWALTVHRLDEAGGQILSATEDVDPSTATGRFTRGMLAEIAAWRAEQIGEVWTEVLERRRRLGVPSGRSQAFGYRRVSKDSWVPDEETGPLLAELYRRYISGAGWHALEAWLAGRGVSNPRTGRPYTSRGVQSILDSGFGAGLLHTDAGEYFPAVHEPVIDKRTWQAFLAARARRHRIPARLVTATTPLAGLVRCGSCGFRMWARSDPDYGPAYTYYCTIHECHRRARVTRKRAEARVKERLGEFVEEVDARARAASTVGADRAVARVEARRLRREITRLEDAVTRLAKDFAREHLPASALAAATEELLAEQGLLAAELEKVEARSSQVVPPRRQVVDLLSEWDRLDSPTLNRLLTALVGEVRVVRPDEGGRCVVRVRFVWEDEAL